MAKGLDCDDVDEMMEEMTELTDAANETQLVLNEELDPTDEEHLELELREIQGEHLTCSSKVVAQQEVPASPSPRRNLLALATAPKVPSGVQKRHLAVPVCV